MSVTSQQFTRRQTLKLMGATVAGAVLGGYMPLTQTVSASTSRMVFDAAPTKGKVRFRIETGPGKDFEAVVAAFTKEFPDIAVEFTQIDPASAGAQWARIAIEQELVDLVSTENPKFLYLDPKIKAGMIQPLDKWADMYKWKDALLPEAIKRSSRSGQLWAVPAYYEICGIAYRKSTLESVGGAVPQTWAEFVALLGKFKDKGLVPLAVGHRGFSQIQMLHYQLWGSNGGVSGPGSITDVIFGTGKYTDKPCVQAAKDIAELYDQGLLDKDCLSITQDDAAERFLGGKAAMHITGTWFYSEMKRNFEDDWDMFTAPGSMGKPVWCTGETEAMVIPHNAADAEAAAFFLDYVIQGNGAKILREQGNLLSSTKYGELAIPQVKHLPIVTGEPSSLLIYGWMPQETQDAYQVGIGGVLDKTITAEKWAEDIQAAWDLNVEDGLVPADRASLL